MITQEKLVEFLSGLIKEKILSELNIGGINKEFSRQRSTNFVNYKKHMNDLVAKGIEPEFIDFSNGVAIFKIKSATWMDKKGKADAREYQMAIRFYDWNKFFDDPTIPFVDKIKRMASGNLGIACGCDSFKAHFGYQTHIKGSEFFDDSNKNLQSTIPAPITNPTNIGIGCKHLSRLLNPYIFRGMVLPAVAKSIFEKLPKNVPISPSAPNSQRVAAGVGKMNKKQ